MGNSAHTVRNDEDATYTTNNDIQVAWEISPHLSANCYVRSHVTCDLKWKFNMSQRVTLFHLLNTPPHNATTNITDERRKPRTPAKDPDDPSRPTNDHTSTFAGDDVTRQRSIRTCHVVQPMPLSPTTATAMHISEPTTTTKEGQPTEATAHQY